jgi:hypothetical protein
VLLFFFHCWCCAFICWWLLYILQSVRRLAQTELTKNIKLSDELAKRLVSDRGFHSTYAQIIEMLLDFYEKHHQQKHDGNKKKV